MALNVPMTPATGSIFNVPNVFSGTGGGPVPGNFGITGPNVPFVSWAPRGDTTDQTGPASFLNFGIAPISHGHPTLKSFDFIQYAYTVPPWDDDSHMQIMENMLVWTLNEMEPDLDTHHLRTLPQLNQHAAEAFDLFTSLVSEGDEEAVQFSGFLKKYGERGLEDYVNAKGKGRLQYEYRKKKGDAPSQKSLFESSDLKLFWELAQKDTFCYMTQWGIRNMWSFAGSVINLNRGTSLEIMDHTRDEDHFVQVNVGLAKRTRVGNVFGTNDKVTTGSQVWVTLRRKHMADNKSGAFEFVPGGDTMMDRPLLQDTRYFDDSGAQCFGHVWSIGKVTEPGDFDPQISAMEGATNLGSGIGAIKAYDCHGTLPTLILAMGFKH